MEVSLYNAKIVYIDDASKCAQAHALALVLASDAAKCLRFPGNAVGKQAFP